MSSARRAGFAPRSTWRQNRPPASIPILYVAARAIGDVSENIQINGGIEHRRFGVTAGETLEPDGVDAWAGFTVHGVILPSELPSLPMGRK